MRPDLGRWAERAACADDPDDPSWFVDPRLLTPRTRRRLALTCWECPVRTQCLISAVREGTACATRAGYWFNMRGHKYFWALPVWIREGSSPREETRHRRNLGEPV